MTVVSVPSCLSTLGSLCSSKIWCVLEEIKRDRVFVIKILYDGCTLCYSLWISCSFHGLLAPASMSLFLMYARVNKIIMVTQAEFIY